MGILRTVAATAIAAAALADPSARALLLDQAGDAWDRVSSDVTLTSPAADGTSGRYSYEFLTDAGPGRWDACESISYVISRRDLPSGGVEAVHRQVDVIERHTGLDFDYRGLTERRVDSTFVEEAARGKAQGDVIIGWSAVDGTDMLSGGTESANTGLAARSHEAGGKRVKEIVAAAVVLDTRFADPALRETTILHELGHVVGLDHVDSADEVMQPVPQAGQSLGNGDRAGLRELGAGGCF